MEGLAFINGVVSNRSKRRLTLSLQPIHFRIKKMPKWSLIGIGILAAACVGLLMPIFAGDASRPAWGNGTENGQEVGQIFNNDVAQKVADEFVSWNQFRGPGGRGISADAAVPREWNEKKNLAWKAKLPGAGASSPILTRSYVFITSYSGYGMPTGQGQGRSKSLVRHLSCFERKSGELRWSKEVKNEAKEDPYRGMGLPEHGYATNTPVTDGNHVYVFYGKSGVLCYDMQGNEIWKTSVGQQSANRQWGSAASLVLYKNLVIVNASEEDRSIIALDKANGKLVWKAPGEMLELCYSTPAIVEVDEKREDLVIALPGELWGLNPNTGKLVWYVKTPMAGNLSPSLNVLGNRVYAFGGYRQTGSIGIEVSGKGELDSSQVLWTSRNTSYVPTPVLVKDQFYWIDNKGVYYCASQVDGELIHRERVPMSNRGGHPVYASAIAVNGLVYCQTRKNGVFVIEPSEKLNIVSNNRFASDSSEFNATPAVDSGQMFIRSNQFLYCIQKDVQ